MLLDILCVICIMYFQQLRNVVIVSYKFLGSFMPISPKVF